MSDVVGDVDVLARLVERARALIDNAGDGDWNRESAEWQLAAAKWRRDLEGVGVVPDPFVLEPDIGVEAAVARTIDAASTCWSEIRNAGVFDSARAELIGVTFLGWLSDWVRTRPEQAPPTPHQSDYRAVPIQSDYGGYCHGTVQAPTTPHPVGTLLGCPSCGQYYTEPGGGGPERHDARPVWQEELDQEQVAASLARTGFPEGTFRGMVREAAECPDCGFTGQWLVDGKDGVLLAEVCPSCRHRYEVPQQEAQEPQEARAGLDLGDDPDGDVEGYDGPLGRPGGYCHGSQPWHPYGTVAGCCAFGGQCSYDGQPEHARGSKPGCLACATTFGGSGSPPEEQVAP